MTPPPIRREQASALSEEVRALATRSSELLARIDDLCRSVAPAPSGSR